MSYTIDANVLLYASDDTSPFHDPATAFIEDLVAGPEIVYLFWPTLMAYLRIGTHPAIFGSPLAPAEASSNVTQLLSLPHVRSPGEQHEFWQAFSIITSGVTVRGNQVPDAHLVSLMVENELRTIYSHDRDFRRFPEIAVIDPFE